MLGEKIWLEQVKERMVKEAMETVGVNNSFKELRSEGEEKNGTKKWGGVESLF